MVNRRNTIVPFFNRNNLPSPRQCLLDDILLKKKNQLGEMLVVEIIEFKLRAPGPPDHTSTSTTGYFHNKTKTSKANL